MAVRLELLNADGVREEIDDFKVTDGYQEFLGSYLRGQQSLLRTRPGRYVTVSTDDPRVAVAAVTSQVPDPVPPLLTVTVPSKEHPGLKELVLEVVDAITGAPLPDAVLHWGKPQDGPVTQSADAHGRIAVHHPPAATETALMRFSGEEHYVHAPGYRGAGWSLGGREFSLIRSVDATALASWLADGRVRIALQPLAAMPGMEERAIKLLASDGSPAVGAYVHISSPFKGFDSPLYDGDPYDVGFQRADERGIVRFPMRDVIGVEVRRKRVLLATWALARAEWPGSGPRTLRLPPVAEAELTIEGLPEGKVGRWTRDTLGPKRHPGRDGPCMAPLADATALEYLKARDAWLNIGHLDLAYGDLAGSRATIRVELAAGRTHALYLSVAGQERVWTVTPKSGGPLRLTRTWDDLPTRADAPRPR